MGARIKSESEIVNQFSYLGSHVANDEAIIRSRGIQSPKKKDCYAIAYHRKQRLEIWLRTLNRLKEWEKSLEVDAMKEWEIKIR